ncbi:MAG: thioredoxin family protein [Bacteroidota bacterium]|nr:thioredoxin family protein [Bacteroidota bacterium]MDX5430718.1 thioredoxin family protein [Bacteroidota bacterium]MDX5469465.1 thioredoxin family protein [Bacteroidota bacterium]
MVTKVSDQEFNEIIQSKDKVVVKFYADWCGNCRLFAPKFNKMSDKPEYQDITFLDVNAENSPEARKLAGVSNLPFFATFKDGNLVASDFTSKEEVVERLLQSIN